MPQPQGDELKAIRAHRKELRAKYLHSPAGSPPTRGVHHLALICSDVEETIEFYQEFLGFPLVELVENRDYKGSAHFFFDIGNRNMLGFFDFPGHDHPAFSETIGAVQHLALSVDAEHFDQIKAKLDGAGIDYLGPDRGVEDSMYFRDPNGVGLEVYREALGEFEGLTLIPRS
ncbi:MAG TPA: VOC family protein [Sporichthyaceae bacterium]|jgi:glyoxylase I family protein